MIIKNTKIQSYLPWLALLALTFSPHIGLDYVYKTFDGQLLQISHGKYIFFFLTMSVGVYFLVIGNQNNIKILLNSKILRTGFILLLAGIGLAFSGISGWRLITIILIISISAIFAANYFQSYEKNHFLVLGIVVAPYSVPVLGSIMIEFLGIIDINTLLLNAKHLEFNPPRWHFLNNSANGFGFDAALFGFSMIIFANKTKKLISKLFFAFLACIAVYALLNSGTRAAFVFFITALAAYSVFYYGMNGIKLFSLIIFLIGLTVYFTDVWDFTKDFLRITSDFDKTTSYRFQGMVKMWDVFVESPIQAFGFGSADNNPPFQPSNIFYIGMLAEIGIFGMLGSVIIIFHPLGLIIKNIIKQNRLSILRESPLGILFSASVLMGFVPYLMLDFEVWRV